MNRTIGGLPLWMWAAGLGVGVLGFLWVRKSSAKATTTTGAKTAAQPQFSQAQEVQDFQIFSALTGAQQASDLNFLTEVAGLFAGGSSTGTTQGGGMSSGPVTTGGAPVSTTPSPPSTGTAPPATTGVTYLNQNTGQTTTFSQAPPPGYGYSYNPTSGQWGLVAGQGIGYAPAA